MISTLFLILIAVWILRAMVDVGIGLIQILIGLLAALTGGALILIVFILELFGRIWSIAWYTPK